jgi:hypothetical protein
LAKSFSSFGSVLGIVAVAVSDKATFVAGCFSDSETTLLPLGSALDIVAVAESDKAVFVAGLFSVPEATLLLFDGATRVLATDASGDFLSARCCLEVGSFFTFLTFVIFTSVMPLENLYLY